jgi:hypothetical protein
MKLDTIIENQREQLALLRKVSVYTQGPDIEHAEEVIATPCGSVEELESLCQRLEENPELSKKTVIWGHIFSDKTVTMSVSFINSCEPWYALYKCRIIGGEENM